MLLYDDDCGICRWMLARVLGWDRHRRVRPVALQSSEADALLGGMDEQTKMASWHLVTGAGEVRSAGAAFAPLFALLPGGAPLARATDAAQPLVERLYWRVAGNRDRLGRLLPDGARERATRKLRERERSAAVAGL